MRWRTDQRTARCIRGCRRSRAVRWALGMKKLCSRSRTQKGTTEAAEGQSISRWHECCSPSLYAIAQNSGLSSGTVVTLVRWLKSVGRLVPPTSPLREFMVASGGWLGAGNCPEPVQGPPAGSRRAASPHWRFRSAATSPSATLATPDGPPAAVVGPCLACSQLQPVIGVEHRGPRTHRWRLRSASPSKQRADAVQLAVRDAQTLPELHAAHSTACLHAKLFDPRRESLRGMPGGQTRAIPRMAKAADLHSPPAGMFDHFDLDFLHRRASWAAPWIRGRVHVGKVTWFVR